MSSIPLNTIFFHRSSALELTPNDNDLKEVFRYSGISNNSNLPDSEKDKLKKLVLDSTNQIFALLNCRSVYIKFDLSILPDFAKISFSDKIIYSKALVKNLQNCRNIFLFAATLGPEVDKLIFKTSKLNPTNAVFMQAAGAMFIEKYCDKLEDFLFEQEKLSFQNSTLKNKKSIFATRFSPGYGDVSLETQKVFFDILKCQKNLALTLNDSLIMSPEKSVTAFIGVKNAL